MVLKKILVAIFSIEIVFLGKKWYKYIEEEKRNSRTNKLEEKKMGEIEAVNIQVNADIGDVADWFLLKENMSNKKIQKLCYYAQAWSLAKLDTDISTNCTFEAWVHGPVNMKLYKKFKSFGWRSLKIVESDIKMVTDKVNAVFCAEQKEVLEAVWDTYGMLSADELEALTHEEKPWKEQRKGLNPFENSRNEISVETMKEFYRSIALD